MIKYAKIDGYSTIGELGMFSHVYQFIQDKEDTPMVILVHGYEGEAKAFKGVLLINSKTYKSVELEEHERKEIEEYVGPVKQVGFDELIAETVFKESYSGFSEEKEEIESGSNK